MLFFVWVPLRIYNMMREGKFESVKEKVYHAGKTRDINFVRPSLG